MATKKTRSEEDTFQQRLYRSEENKILGGVAGGIGDFFRIDPTIIRLLFILASCFGAMGIIIYLILWAIVPTKSNLTPYYLQDNISEIRSKIESVATYLKNYQPTSRNRNLWPIILIGIGLFFLFKSFSLFNIQNESLIPILLIIIGIAIIFRK